MDKIARKRRRRRHRRVRADGPDALPNELLDAIFDHMACIDMHKSIALVCRRWHQIVANGVRLPCLDACQRALAAYYRYSGYGINFGKHRDALWSNTYGGDLAAYGFEKMHTPYTNLAIAAAVSGHRLCVLRAHPHDQAWHPDVANAACLMGHAAILQDAIVRGRFSPTAFTCAMAAKGGSMACLQMLRLRQTPWDERTLAEAIRGGHIKVLEYALANGCPTAKLVHLKVCHIRLRSDLIDPNSTFEPRKYNRQQRHAFSRGRWRSVRVETMRDRMADDIAYQPPLRPSVLLLYTLLHHPISDMAMCAPADDALQKAHFECIRYACEMGLLSIETRAIQFEISGDIWVGEVSERDLVLDAIDSRHSVCTRHFVDLSQGTAIIDHPLNARRAAALCDAAYLDQFCTQYGIVPDFAMCQHVALEGNTECLTYLFGRAPEVFRGRSLDLMYAAIRSKSIECVAFVRRCTGIGWQASMCAIAASARNLKMLTYLHDNGCLWNENTILAGIHDIDIVTMAHERGCPWSRATTTRAFKSNARAVFEYACAHGCPVSDKIRWHAMADRGWTC